MLVPLVEAVAVTCGGKAGALGALLRAGLPVPEGFVIPFAAYREHVRDQDLAQSPAQPADPDSARQAIEAHPVHATMIDALGRALDGLGDPPVAVRSSSANEDTGQVSAAGQHESFLAVHGVKDVADAVRACWASLFSPRATAYRSACDHDDQLSDDLVMAVIVQRHLDAEVSGVMFTSADASGATEIEASWGLGPSIVGGKVAPDAYRVADDGSVTRTVADKRTRLDRHGTQLVTRDVPTRSRNRPTIGDATAAQLAELGKEVAVVLGGPQDIEWAIAGGRTWVLQARPVTAAPPQTTSIPSAADAPAAALAGTPGSRGAVTGTARIVRGPRDFARVHPGDILVCPFTDPAWTPLLRVAAGVVTETGGALSHAAIVAREHGIPAVLGVPNAMSRLRDDTTVTVDGTAGVVIVSTV